MTTICLIRHGETEWNAQGKIQGRTNTSLNTRGIQQAEECRDFVKDSTWDIIITSPLKRAMQTAQIINKSLNVPLIEMEDFKERSFGDAEGMTLKERMSVYPNKVYPNEEKMGSLNKRVMAGIQKINQQYGQSKVLLVAHGAVISSILSNLSEGEIGTGKTKLINACISNIHFHDDQWQVRDYNQVTHLSDYDGRES
ncbi:histidine phosphatase family protein [Virgibacillus byunsanensis]|uniref:Histidine phosphatase family protein n=1 Tax=Virgibacillus byunsanensis TaxID=570945 RepID=A0ABW3LQZ5_9BACI